MVIINFDKTAVINMDFVADIHIQNDKRTLTVDYASNANVRGGALCCGKYNSETECKFVLEMFYSAIRNGEKCFEFPDEAELQEKMSVARQCGIYVKTKTNRHGGS